MSKLDDILKDGLIDQNEAKQQIKDLMHELIGEDEVYTIIGHTYGALGNVTEHVGDGEAEYKNPRNELRQELRDKVKAL